MKKEQTFTDYTIKIKRVRDVEKFGKGCASYKDKFFLIDIINSYGGGIGFAVKIGKDYGKSLRKVFKEIQEEFYLKWKNPKLKNIKG